MTAPATAGTTARGSESVSLIPSGRKALPPPLAPLFDQGYAVVDCHGSLERYRSLSSELGRLMLVTEVRLRPDGHTYLTKAGPVPAHTDHPAVGFIGWLCIEQDGNNGACQLVDTHVLLDRLGPEAAHLADVLLGCPSLDSTVETGEWPVLSDDGGQARIYWSPWRRNRRCLTPASEVAFQKFRAAILGRERDGPISVRLRQGEALFIDNRRMLHARQAIDEGSRRFLLRHWIERPR